MNYQQTNKNKRKPQIDSFMYGKVPPQARDMESAVLGAIMLVKTAYDDVIDILKPECFYSDANQRIFKAMQSLSSKYMPIDLLTVVEELQKAEDLENVGGMHYVSKLTNSVVSSANIEAHSRIILQKFVQRELIRIGSEIVSMAYEDSTDAFDLLDFTEENVSNLRMGNLKKHYKTLQSIAVENIKKLEDLRKNDNAITGVPSGFEELDMITCGWQPTDLIILAARPSVGKTAFALSLAKNATKAKNSRPVGIFSLEMKDTQLVNRVLSQESEVWLWRFKNGRLEDKHMNDIYSGAERLSNSKILIDDTASISIQEFRSKARVMKRKENVGMIIVDYLQLMTSGGKTNNREQEISLISRELKATAKELDIPVIALSQLSRELEKGGNKVKREPQLSDLRESGAIEQDADVVMFLYKPTQAEIDQDANLEDVFYLNGAKHRSGALFTMVGKFVAHIQKHEYLKVVNKKTLLPEGNNWRPIRHSEVTNFYEPKHDDDNPF